MKYVEVRFSGGKRRLLLDKKIGSGWTRDVYKISDTEVVKVLKPVPKFIDIDKKFINKQLGGKIPNSNLIEYRIWDRIKDKDYSKHFAKCIDVDALGRYLIMEYVPKMLTVDDFEHDGTHYRVPKDKFKDIPKLALADCDYFHNVAGSNSDNIKIIDYGSPRNLAFLNPAKHKKWKQQSFG